MSKARKIDALLDSAILSFAKDGYAGASIREIAGRADTSPGTIHMYFGSKDELFQAASRRIWLNIAQEREDLIQAASRRAAGGAAPLADLIWALTFPIVKRALSRVEMDSAELNVIRSRVPENLGVEVDPGAGRTLVRWIDAMASACPGLSRRDLVWVYSWILGVGWSWQSIDHRYDELLCDGLHRETDEVMADIITFCCAGVEAMIHARGVRADLLATGTLG